MSSPALRVNGLIVGDEFVTSSATTAVPVSPWIAPTLLNSWSNFGGGYATAGYFKDASGVVHVKGMVAGGTASNATILTLPAGYRPAATMQFASSSNDAFCVLTLDNAGNLTVTTGGSTSFVVLNAVSFLAEQ